MRNTFALVPRPARRSSLKTRVPSGLHSIRGGHDVAVLRLRSEEDLLGRLPQRPFSSPVGAPANSGCTLTTPYFRSSFSRLAAIIHRKLIDPPGAATLG